MSVGLGEFFLEVFHDVVGLGHHQAVMHDRGHQPLGVERHIPGLVVFLMAKINLVRDPFQRLFFEHKAHPHRAVRNARVIEVKTLRDVISGLSV
jgi:hypothetical protein